MLVGNKSDLRHLRAVPTEEAKQFACNKRAEIKKKNNDLLVYILQLKMDYHLLKPQHWMQLMLNCHFKEF